MSIKCPESISGPQSLTVTDWNSIVGQVADISKDDQALAVRATQDLLKSHDLLLLLGHLLIEESKTSYDDICESH